MSTTTNGATSSAVDDAQQPSPRSTDDNPEPDRSHWSHPRAWTQFLAHLYHHVKHALVESKTWSLLVFVLLGWLAGLFGWNAVAVCAFNLLGIIPLSAVVSYASDNLSEHVGGDLMSGLINATFGNSVELIVGLS
jgi:Ca2+:H+ antiporter